jgi:hypothetical protein
MVRLPCCHRRARPVHPAPDARQPIGLRTSAHVMCCSHLAPDQLLDLQLQGLDSSLALAGDVSRVDL